MFLDIAILPSIPSLKVPSAASSTFNIPDASGIASGSVVPIPTLNVSVPTPLIILKDVLFPVCSKDVLGCVVPIPTLPE